MSDASCIDRASRRRGAAFLLLVAMVMLVIVTATQWLVRGNIATRNAQHKQLRMRSLVAAIDAVNGSVDLAEPIRLPVDNETDEHIEVSKEEQRDALTAVWYRGDVEITRVVRPARSAPST